MTPRYNEDWIFDDDDTSPREPEPSERAVTTVLTIAPWLIAWGTSKAADTGKQEGEDAA